MKKAIASLLAVLLAVLSLCVYAEDWSPLLAEDGWSYIGYTYGGVTFAVPNDYMSFTVSASDAARGCVLIGGNADFTLQMRVFQPEEMKYEDFRAKVMQEKNAACETRMDGDSEILSYRNTQPTGISELYGIAMTGLDGLLYKISIFTGNDEDCSEDAQVWKIAEVIGRTARHQDFSEWEIEEKAEAPSNGLFTQITNFFNQLKQK